MVANQVFIVMALVVLASCGLVGALVIGIKRRRRNQRALTSDEGGSPKLLTDDRDIFEIYDKPGVFEQVWRPLASNVLPGEHLPLTAEEATAFGMRNPAETYMTRQQQPEAHWFLVPNHARPGLFLGALLDLGALPEGARVHKVSNNAYMNIDGLDVPILAPEILAHATANPWWAKLDEAPVTALERKTFINLTPNGLVRVGRSFTAIPTMRTTGWNAARFERLLEAEVRALAQVTRDFSCSLGDIEATGNHQEDVLFALFESAARQQWPRHPETSDFPERLRYQRAVLVQSIVDLSNAGEVGVISPALERLLERSLDPENDWLRTLLTKLDGEEALLYAEARLALCVAWLARFKQPSHARVQRHFASLDPGQLDRFTEVVLHGLIIGEELVHTHLRRLIERLDARDTWALLSPWIAARPTHVWGWVREYFDEELWEVILTQLLDGDAGAACALVFHPEFFALVEAHLPDLTAVQQGHILSNMDKHPIDPLADELAAIPVDHIRQSPLLGLAYMRCVGRLSPELKERYATDYEQRLVLLLSPMFKLEQLEFVIELLMQFGQRTSLIAIVDFARHAPKPLLKLLEAARINIYERTPDVEVGALSLVVGDEYQGALTQADGSGGLAMVDPEDEIELKA